MQYPYYWQKTVQQTLHNLHYEENLMVRNDGTSNI